jgi:drug/metabolite transporter, DME family
MTRTASGTLAVLLAGLLWGTTGTVASFAPTVSPLAIGAAAMGIGGILQAVIAVPALVADRAQLRANWALVSVGAAVVAIYPLAFYSSIRLGGVALGTVVSIASAPIFAAILERVVDGSPFTRNWVIAGVVAVGGSALLCTSRASDGAGVSLATVAGVGLGLVAGVTYALYSWVLQRLMQRGLGRRPAMGAVFGAGGIALMPVLLITGAPLFASEVTVAVAAYMALVPMFLGYLLFGIGLGRVSASRATTLTLAEPAVAAVLAILVVGERLTLAGWIGLTFIGIGLAVLALPQRNPEQSSTVLATALQTQSQSRNPLRGMAP